MISQTVYAAIDCPSNAEIDARHAAMDTFENDFEMDCMRPLTANVDKVATMVATYLRHSQLEEIVEKALREKQFSRVASGFECELFYSRRYGIKH
jgi:hypothetical protein